MRKQKNTFLDLPLSEREAVADSVSRLKAISADDIPGRDIQRGIKEQLAQIWQLAESEGLLLDRDLLEDWAEPFEEMAGVEHVVIVVPKTRRVLNGPLGF